MRYAILLTILSLGLMGVSSCQEKPDAYLCTFVHKNPLEASYSFCVNYKTKEEKSIPVNQMKKWITTDPDSYKTIREFYKESCTKGLQNEIQ